MRSIAPIHSNRFLNGVVAGSLAGAGWLAASYAGHLVAGYPFLPFRIFDWLARVLPGSVVTLGLEVMIGMLQRLQLGSTATLGKLIESIMAIGLALLVLAILGGVFNLLSSGRSSRYWLYGAIIGLVLWVISLPLFRWTDRGLASVVASAAWPAVLSLGWGISVAWAVRGSTAALEGPVDLDRRGSLRKLGIGSLAVGGLALGIGKLLDLREEPIVKSAPPLIAEPIIRNETIVSEFRAVAGTRDQITPMEDFYRVDINIMSPDQGIIAAESAGNLAQVLQAQGETEIEVPLEGYALTVDGLVERPLVLSLDQLREGQSVSQSATLECISNMVGGDLISTTLFTGVALRDVLMQAGVLPGAVDIKFTCADGYTESLPLASANDERTLLCYAMGGRLLTQAHGAPLRLYVPDRFGMKNPKWIVRIELMGEDYQGYWQQRGWSEEAWVQTTAVIDAAISSRPGNLDCGGIAYAGARGIQRVEVQLDDGEWFPADLQMPLSPLSWVLWRRPFEAPVGKHKLTVRAVDGTGAPQMMESSPAYPDGATGYHSRSVNVTG